MANRPRLHRFKQFAFTFGKGLGKDTLKDSLNGGWNEAQNNFVANLAGNAIGSGTGPLLDKGFAKIRGSSIAAICPPSRQPSVGASAT